MGIRKFFHKIKMFFVRAREYSLPDVDETKCYGNDGEDEFVDMLSRELPFCRIKRNIIIWNVDGCAEIDCLVCYENKLFAIEVKRWKGCITEYEGGFFQEKTDRWTGETHTKILKSPFKQLGRAIFLLRKQVPIQAWVNPIVFFEDDELESVSVSSDHVWFDCYQELADYIRNDGKPSFGSSAIAFFEKCISADYLEDVHGNTCCCLIYRDSLQFGSIPVDKIVSIHIIHHWYYDELYIKLMDNTERIVALENGKIQYWENGVISSQALCKLDYIELGNTQIQ